eukprot:14274546-Alexandrium_andersonii.AAC.1
MQQPGETTVVLTGSHPRGRTRATPPGRPPRAQDALAPRPPWPAGIGRPRPQLPLRSSESPGWPPRPL